MFLMPLILQHLFLVIDDMAFIIKINSFFSSSYAHNGGVQPYGNQANSQHPDTWYSVQNNKLSSAQQVYLYLLYYIYLSQQIFFSLHQSLRHLSTSSNPHAELYLPYLWH